MALAKATLTASQPAMNRERRLSWTLQHLPVDSHWWYHYDYSSPIKPYIKAYMETWRKVREEEDDHSDGGEGGVGWPLGHSSQVRRDWDNNSLVSRTDTCVSKIYWADQFSRWLHGAWQLTWPAWRCEPCLEYKQLQRHEKEGNRGSGRYCGR